MNTQTLAKSYKSACKHMNVAVKNILYARKYFFVLKLQVKNLEQIHKRTQSPHLYRKIQFALKLFILYCNVTYLGFVYNQLLNETVDEHVPIPVSNSY